MPGTPNPDFDAEPWCDNDQPVEPDGILVQADTSEPLPDPEK